MKSDCGEKMWRALFFNPRMLSFPAAQLCEGGSAAEGWLSSADKKNVQALTISSWFCTHCFNALEIR